MKIGFIGLGIMGGPMAANIVKKHGDEVFVFNRTREKENALLEAGAKKVNDVAELARKSDVIITMVTRGSDVEQIFEQIKGELTAGKIWIDMSTIEADISLSLSQKVKALGSDFADAPVVKSKAAAIAGKLGIYVGAEKPVFEKIEPILCYMGENVKYFGGNGKGITMKIIHNALVSQIQNGVNETLSLALANGISVTDYAEAVSYGGGKNLYLESKAESLAKEDFSPAFALENMQKDVNLALRLARQSGVRVPGEENVAKVYERALRAGFGKEDFSASFKAVQKTGGTL